MITFLLTKRKRGFITTPFSEAQLKELLAQLGSLWRKKETKLQHDGWQLALLCQLADIPPHGVSTWITRLFRQASSARAKFSVWTCLH
jgi:hypothetical protein